MNKKIKVMITTMIITFSMSATALAYESPVNDLKNELVQAGIPSNYIGNIVDYLQKKKINQNKANAIMSKMNEVKGLIGDTNDLSSLSIAEKAKIQGLAAEAGKIVGLNVAFGKDASGVTTMVVTTPNGGTLVQLTTLEVMDLATNFNADTVVDAIQESVDFSNNTNKNDKPHFNPEGGGKLNTTATPYGDMMFAGTAMIGMAAGVYFMSRKKEQY